MKSCHAFIAGLGMLALPICSYADLGPIVITPSRTAQPRDNTSATVYVMGRGQIESSGAVTTSELLRGIPGVQIDDLFGNGTNVSIGVRGFSATANANTLVLVNGRRLNHSDTAGPDLQHIFPRDIERIEVMVGSAGSLYGDQAVGGVINIITRGPTASDHRVSLRAGSYDYRGVQFNSSMQLNESLGYRLSAETFDTDHYREHNAEKNSNFSGVLDYNRGADRLFAEYQAIDDELELPGALLEDEFEDDPRQVNPGFANDFRNDDTRVSRLGYERELGMQQFSIDGTRRRTESDVLQSFRDNPSPGAGFIDRENRSINPKLSGMLDFALGTSYVIGMDFEETDFDLQIPNAFGTTASSSTQNNDSLYFQVSPRVTQSLQLVVGARRSKVENDLDYADSVGTPARAKFDDDITVGELGLVYSLDQSTRLRLRYDENFRFAKIDELSFTEAGTLLDTQTGESWELGFEIDRGRQSVSLSLYQLDLENEIAFDPTAGPDPFGFGPIGANVNLDKTRRRGMTLSWTSRMGDAFTLQTDIGLVDASYESGLYDGNEISGVADKIARLRGDYRLDDMARVYLVYNYSSPKYAQGDNANEFGKLGSITVINAGFAYRYESWDIDLRINNLNDESYAEFVTNNGFGAAYQPSPGRNYFVTAGYRFE